MCVEFKLWLEVGMPFLAGKVDNNLHHIVKEMLNSMDINQHLVGIDVADLKHFLKNEESLLITQHTVQSDFNEQWLFKILPDMRLLFIHIEVGMSSDLDYPGSLCCLSYIGDALNQWITIDPDRLILFSVVSNEFVRELVNVWMLTTKN